MRAAIRHLRVTQDTNLQHPGFGWCCAVVLLWLLLSTSRASAQRLAATHRDHNTAASSRTSAPHHASDRRLAYAQELAGRGAVFAAASEFENVLTGVANLLDAQAGTRIHFEALAAGLQALTEADDFYRLRTSVDVETSLHMRIQAHKTSILKSASIRELTPMEALQAYHAFALSQLTLAGGHDENATDALYGLARLQPSLAGASGNDNEVAVGARIMTLLQAALSITPNHHETLNELGVVFAKYNRLEEARGVFQRALKIHATAETWHNLATVLERLGRREEAAQAQAHFEHAKQKSDTLILVGSDVALPQVRWVDPAEFSSTESPAGSGDVATPVQAPVKDVAPREKEPDSNSRGLFSTIRQRFRVGK